MGSMIANMTLEKRLKRVKNARKSALNDRKSDNFTVNEKRSHSTLKTLLNPSANPRERFSFPCQAAPTKVLRAG